MEPETRRKIEEMVMDILKISNIEEATEFDIRVAASERLGIDLSDPERKQLVRNVVESYLLAAAAAAAEDGGEKPRAPDENRELVQSDQEAKPKKSRAPEETRDLAHTEQQAKPKKESDRVICQLSNRRNVVVQDFRGKTLVSIREFYQKDGKQHPTAKGISLSTEQWSTFKKSVPAIEEAITKMEAKIRSELHDKQNGDVSNSVLDAAPLELDPIEISRFDGKNYHFWLQQMELLLKQLKIEYVLTSPCPNATLGEDASAEEIAEAKAAERRWVNDDLLCRRNILSHLSDHLFNQYTNRKMSAKELWEELKRVYLYEEFGAKRSQVKKYIEFQMVDEKPIVEQIQELNSIADSIVAAGMFVDDNFHINVIISKLPPSWKDFCIRLMCEEYLPFWMLMERVTIEEETRNRGKQAGKHSSNPGFYHAKRGGPRGTDSKPPGMHRNRPEINGKGTIVCYICGKKGHLPKNCWRRSDKQANERGAEENRRIRAEVNM